MFRSTAMAHHPEGIPSNTPFAHTFLTTEVHARAEHFAQDRIRVPNG